LSNREVSLRLEGRTGKPPTRAFGDDRLRKNQTSPLGGTVGPKRPEVISPKRIKKDSERAREELARGDDPSIPVRQKVSHPRGRAPMKKGATAFAGGERRMSKSGGGNKKKRTRFGASKNARRRIGDLGGKGVGRGGGPST